MATLREGTLARARPRTRGPEMDSVVDLRAEDLPVRLYRPSGDAVPLVVYLHGGGWTIGSVQTHDRVCRRLAAGAACAVLSVDYRLAPEHPWPASVDDAVATMRWVSGTDGPVGPTLGAITGAVAVAGDSGGGTLAALCCLRLRDEHPDSLPDLQVLLNANTDLTGAQPSMREKATGWGLDAPMVRFFNSQWVPDVTMWSDPGVSPLLAPDLSGLPAALIVSAEHDPLRDEAEAYARGLRAAGVDVHLRREPGLVHNFIMLDEVSPACAAAADRVAADLRTRLTAG
ncbi:MAG: alpha/beta hydrolase [Solirubrobacteraceae bacterium]